MNFLKKRTINVLFLNFLLLRLLFLRGALLWMLLSALTMVVAFASEGLIKEVELPEELSSAQSISVDVTGRVWFTEKVGKTLTMYDPEKKAFTSHSLPATWGDVGFSKITTGPEGDIWFTVNRWAEGTEEPHVLGKFTPNDGFFTRYKLSIDSIPEELLIDDGGVIWFLAANKNSLYRVDPGNFVVKGYALPTANGYPKSLAIDNKGHIWFVEANANKIAKFVPEQEVFHEYELPTRFANPGKLTIDKDGKVWFVELQANRIGVFYPDLVRFDEAIIPTPRSSPNAIVADENGYLWFLQYRGNKVGAFNPQTAVFHEYNIPTFGSLPAELVLDRQRSILWFTESSTEAKRLGMLSISEALAEIKKQEFVALGSPAEQVSLQKGTQETAPRWIVFLVMIIALVITGSWLKHSRNQR